MNEKSPRFSFGLPVRNGERAIRRTFDSLLAQDFEDIEVVVSDNASTDSTPKICEEYAARDPRVRFQPNDRDLGQIENFNRAYRFSQGEIFRWIGCGDVIAPGYARRCVEALDANPGVVGATTGWRFVDEQGAEHSLPFHGERIESTRLLRRLDRFLWFMQNNRLLFDPMYSALRRSALEKTRMLRIHHYPDLLLAMELALLGPYCHVEEVLSTREMPRSEECYAVLWPRWHPSLRAPRGFQNTRKYLSFFDVLMEQDLPRSTRTAGAGLVLYYWARERPLYFLRRVRGRLARMRSRHADRRR